MVIKTRLVKKYYVPTIIAVVSAFILAIGISYLLPSPINNSSSEKIGLQFPVGIPPALGAVSTTQINGETFNTISVTGTGSAIAKADEATVTLGVETQEETASEAVRVNAEKMNKVIEALKALGITEEQIRTVAYSVYPVYDKYDYNTVVGYRVINTIAVTITDMELIGEVIDTASENGANRIQGVSFGLSSESQAKLKREAYLNALEDAEEKAKLIAEKLNLTITGVLYVSESTYQPYQPYREYFAVKGEASTPIIEGNLSVSVTVHVIYSFE